MDTRARATSVEWPTLGLILATYGAWGVSVFNPLSLPLWVLIPLLSVTLVMHASLQHEAIHGHPFRSPRLSHLVMHPGVGLVIPFDRFHDLHLAHHRDSNLTDPYDDPESHYFDPAHYHQFGRPIRLILCLNNTLLGRLVLGPAVGIEGVLRTEWAQLRAGSPTVRRAWLRHGLTALPVVALVAHPATIPFWAYLVAVYVSLSILKIRTFAEHQAHALASGRSVIIEDRGPLAFLFLNNNLHSVHHSHPGVPWYDLPRLFRSRRAIYLARNRGYYFASYAAVFHKYLLRSKEPVPHPLPPTPKA